MEMEDHSHTNQYGLDLRQLIGGRPAASSSHIPPLIPHQPPELFPGHTSLGLPSHQHYDLMMLMPRSGLHLHDFPGASTARGANSTPNIANSSAVAAASSSPGLANAALIGSSSSGMVEVEGGCFGGGDISGTGRWPRQETLTLLEIRSSLDSKFKEANQKGHLWEEVSRIMAEEHGYQRSGKKCREKFENLYKYYKKTKEGKAGRQDGKHYRFFRQLDALYGDTSNNYPSSSAQELTRFVGFNPAINKLNCNNTSLSLSNSSEFDTTSEEENQSTATLGEKAGRRMRRGGSGRSWKTKVKEFLDAQMRKVMERQDAWLERLKCTLEEKEKERLEKEDEWRKREVERVDREHRFWAKEREWIETRDAALMEALQKLKGRDHHQQVNASISSPELPGDHRHQEETRDGGNKKRKENSRSSVHFEGNESMCHPGGDGGGFSDINNEQCGDNNNNNNNNVAINSCFRFLMSGNIVEGDDLWENYGLKPTRGGEHGSQ